MVSEVGGFLFFLEFSLLRSYSYFLEEIFYQLVNYIRVIFEYFLCDRYWGYCDDYLGGEINRNRKKFK